VPCTRLFQTTRRIIAVAYQYLSVSVVYSLRSFDSSGNALTYTYTDVTIA